MGFGLFGNKTKTAKASGGGFFGGLSGITSKMSDTLNTAVKEVSAAAEKTASVAAQTATKTSAATASKPGGINLPSGLGIIKPPATTVPSTTKSEVTPVVTSTNSRQQLKKQESVTSEQMPLDEADKSGSSLPDSGSQVRDC